LQADAAAARYAPPYLRVLEPVRAQFSRFARGDSEVVVAAWDARGDSLIGRKPTGASVIATAGARQVWISDTRGAGQSGSGQVSAPRQNLLVGVELRADSDYAAARVRQGLAPLATVDGRTLSDILLFHPGGPLPENLAEAVPLAEAGAAQGDTAVGLYWELYTPNAGAPGEMSVSLSITRGDRSWWTRARRALHVGGHGAPIALQWRDVARPEHGIVARALVVDLARLQPGTYRIRLRVQPAGSAPLEAERQLHIDIAAR
jgi:hypothetical protein